MKENRVRENIGKRFVTITHVNGKCEDIHRVNLPLHAVELRQLPPYQLLEYLEKIWKVPS
jgi:hypothetical protein